MTNTVASKHTGILSIIKNTIYILSGQGIQFGMRFIYAIILARTLGPHDYGIISYGTSLYIAVLPVTKLGIELVIIRAIGCDKEYGRKLIKAAQPLRKLIAYLCTLIFAAATYISETDPQTKIILVFFSIALLGRSFANWNLAMFTAYEANKFSFRLQSIFRPLEVILGLSALALWRTPLAVVLTHAATWWLEVILGSTLLKKHFRIPTGKWNSSILKAIVPEALPVGLSTTLSLLLTQRPLIIFKYLNGPGITTGNLALGMQVFAILSQLPIAANNASYPALSRSVARGDGKEIMFVETMMRLIIFFGSALALLGMAFGGALVVFVFGSKYAEAGTLIGTSLWLMIPWSAINALSKVQMARQKYYSNLAIFLIGAGTFLLIIKPITDAYGIQGPVLASLTGMSAVSFLLLLTISREGTLNINLTALKPLGAMTTAIASFYLLAPFGSWPALLGAWSTLILSWWIFGCLTAKEISLLATLHQRYGRHDNAREK